MQENIYHYMHFSAQCMVLGSISCLLKCGHRCSSSLRMLCEMFGINLLSCTNQLHLAICIDMWWDHETLCFHFARTSVPHSFTLEFSNKVCVITLTQILRFLLYKNSCLRFQDEKLHFPLAFSLQGIISYWGFWGLLVSFGHSVDKTCKKIETIGSRF